MIVTTLCLVLFKFLVETVNIKAEKTMVCATSRISIVFLLTISTRHLRLCTTEKTQVRKRGPPSHISSIFPRRPETPNWDEYLTPFQKSGCLLLLDNFLNIDTPGTENKDIPVVIRNLYSGSNNLSETIAHRSCQFANDRRRNNKSYSFGVLPKPSHIFKDTHELCVYTNMLYYSILSKPWICQVQFSLFPPKNVSTRSKLLLPLIPPGIKHILPSSRPTINVLVTSQIISLHNSTVFKRWISDPGRESSHADVITHTIYILMETKIEMNPKDIRTCHRVLRRVRLVRICHSCENFILLKDLNDSTWNNLSSLETPLLTANEGHLWNISYGHWSKVSLFNKQMHYCNNNISSSEYGLVMPHVSIEQRFVMAHAHVWMTIMGNYTFYNKFLRRKCQNGERIHYNQMNEWEQRYFQSTKPKFAHHWVNLEMIIHHGRPRLHYPVDVDGSRSNYRFISCGKKTRKNLVVLTKHFQIYDLYVWVGTGVSIILLVIALHMLEKNDKADRAMSAMSHLTCAIKGLTEQRNPFTKLLKQQNTSLNLLIEMFLFIGIVLSNSYKNTNVYNMIRERKQLGYQTYQELLDGNFTIYTRTAFYDLAFDRRGKDQWNFEERELSREGEGHQFVDQRGLIHVKSELLTLSDTVFTEFDKPAKFKALFKNVTLHASVFTALLEILEIVIPFGQAFGERMIEIEPGVHEMVWSQENDALLAHMEECERSAMLLPQYMCINMTRQLMQRNSSRHVSIGKEAFTEINYGFVLSGQVPPAVIWRLKGVEMAGLWKWWRDFTGGNQDIINSWVPRNPEKPSVLCGNALVVFLVLGGGLLTGVVGLLLEHLWPDLVEMFACLKRAGINSCKFCGLCLIFVLTGSESEMVESKSKRSNKRCYRSKIFHPE